MNKEFIVNFRKARKSDIDFLSQILVSAAASSGIELQVTELPSHPDTYQYVQGFPEGIDTGILAQTKEGTLIGAAWVRLLPTDAHAINEVLPELTMGVIPEYQRLGIGKKLLEELYKAVFATGISKISLGVHKNNISAIKLYQQQNWIEEGRFKEYIMMRKTLNKGTDPSETEG